jgi:hypothetical protein
MKSLSNHVTKRGNRQSSAQSMQHDRFTLSHFIQLMKSPEFREYFNTDFQNYLKGKRDLTVEDGEVWDKTELDIVMYLQSLMNKVHGKPVHLKKERQVPAVKTILGDRTGVRYVKFPVKPSDNSISGMSKSSASASQLVDNLQHLGVDVNLVSGEPTFSKGKRTYIIVQTSTGFNVMLKRGSVSALIKALPDLNSLVKYVKNCK